MAIEQSTFTELRELALFAGAGGGILGGQLLGWKTVCAVERDAYAATILAQRQNDGYLEPFPIWSDIETFEPTPWRGCIDVVSGGFPCQDISVAGKGAGISGKRSGLWKQMVRIIRGIQPWLVFIENSPALTTRGLDVVLGDLAESGFDAEWSVLSAAEVGAPHKRERIWILAKKINPNANKSISRQRSCKLSGRENINFLRQNIPNTMRQRLPITRQKQARTNGLESWRSATSSSWWNTEPGMGRVVNGLANRVDRIKCLGNGQVPLCAAEAFIKLYNRLTK